MTDRRFYTSLVAVVIAAACLRVPELDLRGLWLDELFTARVVGRESWAGLVEEVAQDVHPPGYFALLRLWIGTFGASDATLRWPSVVAGLAAVGMVGLLGRQLAGPAAGLGAAALLSTAPFTVWLDREARSNALLALLSVVGAWLLARPTRRRWLAYAVVASALLWVHAFGFFVLLAHGLWIVADAVDGERPASELGRWLACILVAALSFAPWSGALLAQHRDFALDPWYSPPPADAFAWIYRGLAGDSATLAVGLLFGLGLAVGAPGGQRAATLVLAHCFAVVMVPAVFSMFDAPILRDRNAIALTPVLCVAAAAGFARLRPAVAAMAMALLVGTGAIVAVRGTRDAGGEAWREVAGVVNEGFQPGDTVLATHPNLWAHYLRPEILATEAPRVDPARWLSRHPGGRTWLLEGHDLDEGRWAAFAASGLVIRTASFPGARALLVDRGVLAITLGTELGPPLRDETGLHLYWSVSTRSAPIAVEGACRIGVVGHGENPGGIAATLALRWIAWTEGQTLTTTSTVELPDVEAEILAEPYIVHGPVAVELEFLNDTVGPEGGDRNAHVRSVFVRCEPITGE